MRVKKKIRDETLTLTVHGLLRASPRSIDIYQELTKQLFHTGVYICAIERRKTCIGATR